MSVPEMISVALTREQAYLASVGLLYQIDTILNDRVDVADAFTEALSGHGSAELRDQMRDVARHVAVLDAVGWPHEHYLPGFEFTDPDIRAKYAREVA